jgi:hypothetical protein
MTSRTLVRHFRARPRILFDAVTTANPRQGTHASSSELNEVDLIVMV